MSTPSKNNPRTLGHCLIRLTDEHFLAMRKSYVDSLADEKMMFSKDDKNAFIELAKTLKQIHVRLLMEGYVIEQGRIYKP